MGYQSATSSRNTFMACSLVASTTFRHMSNARSATRFPKKYRSRLASAAIGRQSLGNRHIESLGLERFRDQKGRLRPFAGQQPIRKRGDEHDRRAIMLENFAHGIDARTVVGQLDIGKTRPGGSARAKSTASRWVVAMPVTRWPLSPTVCAMSNAMTGSSSMIRMLVGGCSRSSCLPAKSAARTSSSRQPMITAICPAEKLSSVASRRPAASPLPDGPRPGPRCPRSPPILPRCAGRVAPSPGHRWR